MSGLVKGVGKIFKKIGNLVKKVAVPLLAVAAIAFTGGAALGLAPLAGGWGGAVASGISAMGIQGPLAGILTTVGTQAGTGAAVGGLAGLASGQGFTKGATMGAIGGALTGGLTSAGLMPGAAATQGATMSSRSAGGLMGGGAQTITPTIADPSVVQGAATGGAASVGPAGIVAPTAAGAAPAAAAPAVARTGIGGLLGNVVKSPVFGQTLAGLGQGLMTGMQAKDAQEADLDILRRRTASYEGVEEPGAAPEPEEARPTPRSKWGARHRRRYNPETGRIEEVA